MFHTKALHSIRLRITAIALLFTLVLSLLSGAIAYAFFENASRVNLLQTTEYNLQVVSQMIEQDLFELQSLAVQQSVSQATTQYLRASTPTNAQKLSLFNEMNAAVSQSFAGTYVYRYIVVRSDLTSVYLTPYSSSSSQVTEYNIMELPFFQSAYKDVPLAWQEIVFDPFSTNGTDSIVLTQPIYDFFAQDYNGVIYLTVSTKAITDSFITSEISGSEIYFQTGAGTWLYEGGALTQTTIDVVSATPNETIITSGDAALQDITLADGSKYTQIAVPIGSYDCYVTYLIPDIQSIPLSSILNSTSAWVFCAICLLSFGLYMYLNRLLVQPIVALQAHIHNVSTGDFRQNPNIEWNNEMGDIGRGVNQLAVNVDQLMTRRLEDQRKHQEMEYRMLQSEINPHFIYNTLNSIRWMATIQHANGIAEMVTSLSRLLKSVSKGNEKLVPLKDELALLNDYFLIQQYRYGGDLEMDVAYIEDETICRDCFIPRFSLQPIAENAIFHGLEPAGGAGSILLDIRTEGGDVVIRMTDSGVGMPAETLHLALAPPTPAQAEEKYRHVGLWNVHKRIQYSFGKAYGLSLESEVGKGTTVKIRLPYQPNNQV